LIWSFSKLVFPHQICRLILTEQIYRAQEINLGHPYHHA
jgi:23S rRNA (pseudouridine1915-N3)-methyltransferase